MIIRPVPTPPTAWLSIGILLGAVLLCGCGPRLTKQQIQQRDLHLDQAMLYFQYGKVEKADDQFKRVLKIVPEHYAALVGAGYCAAATRRYQEGAELLERARKVNDEDPYCDMGVGMVYYEWGRESGARAEQLEALARSYSDPRVPGGDPERAKNFLADAEVERKESNERLRIALEALQRAEKGYDERAEDEDNEELATKNNGYLLRLLALAHAAMGKTHYGKAIEYLDRHNRRVAALREEYRRGMEKERPKLSDTQLLSAKVTLEGMARQERKTRIFKSWLHFELGNNGDTKDAAQMDLAQAEIKEVMRLSPDSPNPLLNQAQILSGQGKHKEAVAVLKRFLKANTHGDANLDALAREGIRRGGDLRDPAVITGVGVDKK